MIKLSSTLVYHAATRRFRRSVKLFRSATHRHRFARPSPNHHTHLATTTGRDHPRHPTQWPQPAAQQPCHYHPAHIYIVGQLQPQPACARHPIYQQPNCHFCTLSQWGTNTHIFNTPTQDATLTVHYALLPQTLDKRVWLAVLRER